MIFLQVQLDTDMLVCNYNVATYLKTYLLFVCVILSVINIHTMSLMSCLIKSQSLPTPANISSARRQFYRLFSSNNEFNRHYIFLRGKTDLSLAVLFPMWLKSPRQLFICHQKHSDRSITFKKHQKDKWDTSVTPAWIIFAMTGKMELVI